MTDILKNELSIRIITIPQSHNDIEDMLTQKIPLSNLRHSHATILLNNGENIKVISERLGHRSIKTTMDTYAQVMPKSKSKTADLLDDLMKRTGIMSYLGFTGNIKENKNFKHSIFEVIDKKH